MNDAMKRKIGEWKEDKEREIFINTRRELKYLRCRRKRHSGTMGKDKLPWYLMTRELKVK